MDRRFATLTLCLSALTFAGVWFWPAGGGAVPQPAAEAAADPSGCKDGVGPACTPHRADPPPPPAESAPPPASFPVPSYRPPAAEPQRLG